MRGFVVPREGRLTAAVILPWRAARNTECTSITSSRRDIANVSGEGLQMTF